MVPRTVALTMAPGRHLSPGFAADMQIVFVVGGIVSIAFAFAMPLYIFLAGTLRSIRDAYEGIYVAPGSFEPVLNTLSGE